MKTPRPFTFERDCPRGPAITLGQIGYISGQLLLVNALNDMVPGLASFDQLPYLPGDLIACKLNLVKLKRPRRNPWYKPVKSTFKALQTPADYERLVKQGAAALRAWRGSWRSVFDPTYEAVTMALFEGVGIKEPKPATSSPSRGSKGRSPL